MTKIVEYHCDGCQQTGFTKQQEGKRHCDIGIIVKVKKEVKA